MLENDGTKAGELLLLGDTLIPLGTVCTIGNPRISHPNQVVVTPYIIRATVESLYDTPTNSIYVVLAQKLTR